MHSGRRIAQPAEFRRTETAIEPAQPALSDVKRRKAGLQLADLARHEPEPEGCLRELLDMFGLLRPPQRSPGVCACGDVLPMTHAGGGATRIRRDQCRTCAGEATP
jgi:hypothetical protein